MVYSFRHISRFRVLALGLLALLALLIPSPAFASGLSYDLQEWCKYQTGILQMGSNVGSWTPNENDDSAVLFDDSSLYNVSIVKVDYWVANGQMVGNSSGFRKMQCYALLAGNSGTQNNGISFTDDDDRIDGVFIGNLKWTGLYVSPGTVQSVLTATQIVTAGAAPNGWDYSYYYKRATSFNFSQQGMCMDLSEGYYPKITVLYSRYGGEWTPHKANYSQPYDVVVAQSVNGDERTLLQLILAAMQQELENISDNLGGGSTTVNVDTSTIESNQGTTNSTLGNINTNVTSGFTSVNTTLTSGFSGVNSTLGTVSANITGAVSSAQSAVTGAISTAQSAITSGLSSLGATLSNIASSLPVFGQSQWGNGSGSAGISTQNQANLQNKLKAKAPFAYVIRFNETMNELASSYSDDSSLYLNLPIPYAGNIRFDLNYVLGQNISPRDTEAGIAARPLRNIIKLTISIALLISVSLGCFRFFLDSLKD